MSAGIVIPSAAAASKYRGGGAGGTGAGKRDSSLDHSHHSPFRHSSSYHSSPYKQHYHHHQQQQQQQLRVATDDEDDDDDDDDDNGVIGVDGEYVDDRARRKKNGQNGDYEPNDGGGRNDDDGDDDDDDDDMQSVEMLIGHRGGNDLGSGGGGSGLGMLQEPLPRNPYGQHNIQNVYDDDDGDYDEPAGQYPPVRSRTSRRRRVRGALFANDRARKRSFWSVIVSVLVLVAIIFAGVLLTRVSNRDADQERDDGLLVIAPPTVRGGDVAGFISPAGPIGARYNLSFYPAHVANLTGMLGITYKFGENAFATDGYLAGTDEQRASDVMAMFRDPSVKMIVCNRGGWGSDRILDLLDFDVIAANPKPLMGYSDITTLLNAIHTRTGMVTFHGPMGLDQWNGISRHYIEQVLFQASPNTVFSNVPGMSFTTITPGKARGRLIGGNLSVFQSMIGSAYLPSAAEFAGRILFLEEVGEDPYRIDRMLTTLHLAKVLDHIAGFVFGRCTGCGEPTWQPNAQQVVTERVKSLGVPAFYGSMFGHDLEQQFTLPVGARVEIDADAGTITMLASATSKAANA
eukprot:TRINITY_DN66190_c8_g1_i1.p1 TRINITY_DN66190_c8_g1~~TRINITY_DN66190_c8_g1_i1.p1  ORF type:complete len:573 (+),score=280.19 TRINITY_DN66190_c8_g1_i1:169-1887(+)